MNRPQACMGCGRDISISTYTEVTQAIKPKGFPSRYVVIGGLCEGCEDEHVTLIEYTPKDTQ